MDSAALSEAEEDDGVVGDEVDESFLEEREGGLVVDLLAWSVWGFEVTGEERHTQSAAIT